MLLCANDRRGVITEESETDVMQPCFVRALAGLCPVHVTKVNDGSLTG